MDELFRVDDRVRHAKRPEWGIGRVRAAAVIEHEGRRAQRLTVDFPDRGRTTLNTALAPIVSADVPIEKPTDLSALPPEVDDPLSGPSARLSLLLDLFRFTATQRGMIDWAMMQTGLPDPLIGYERHELESAFRAFLQRRDHKLIEMIGELRKADRMNLVRAALDERGETVRRTVAEVMKR